MSTIQSSSALRVARADLTTTNNTTLYTVPSRYDAIVESIIVSEDSGNADTITITITDASTAVFNLFKTKSISANGTVELLSRDLLLTAGDFLKGEEVLRNLTLKRPNDPQIWYWLAEVQGLDKNIIGLHLSRAEYFYLTGSYETSLKHLRMALELVGNNFQLTETIHNKIERSHKSIEALKST